MPNNQDLFRLYEPWTKLLLWVILAAGLVFAVRQLAPILFWLLNLLAPFLVALVVAYVFHPIVNFVQLKLKLGRIAGILFLAVSVAVVLLGVLAWLIPVLYQQAATLLRAIKTAVPELTDRFVHLDPATREAWQTRLDEAVANLGQYIEQAFAQMGGMLAPVAKSSFDAVSSVAGGVLQSVTAFGGFVATAVLVIIVTFYYLTDMDQVPRIIRKMLPARHGARIWDLMLQADRSVGGFLRGQLTACACVGLLVSVILFFIGLKQYAILIGCFAGVMNFVPYLGPVAGATPAILWALLSQDLAGWDERGFKILLIVGGFAFVQAADGFVFQPFIVGKNASLHPLAVIFALAVGAQAGIGGMIVAVPVACIAKVLWIELYWKNRSDPIAAVPPSGPG